MAPALPGGGGMSSTWASKSLFGFGIEFADLDDMRKVRSSFRGFADFPQSRHLDAVGSSR